MSDDEVWAGVDESLAAFDRRRRPSNPRFSLEVNSPRFGGQLFRAMAQGLAVVLQDAPRTPLAKEFSVALKNMRLGMPRSDALTLMDQRMGNPNLKLFLQTMVQSMDLGTDVNQTLSALSDTFRAKRFQYAEEMAGKISVKMMIPMPYTARSRD